MNSIITETERNYILDNMKSLLAKFGYTYRIDALNDIIDKWATEKAELITAFKRHPNYLEGKFMITFSYDYEREINDDAIYRFSEWLHNVMCVMVSTLPEPIKERKNVDHCGVLPLYLYNFLQSTSNYRERTVSEKIVDYLAIILPEVNFHKGEKTSRMMNRICTYLGYSKHPEYNREFAKFADALSPMVIKRHSVLSINPLDYLTMSFGNSWASCHTIDKENIRNMPNSYEGQYSSGTISYMLDSVSMVFYTVDASYDGNEFWDQPKINRQMFHYGEQKLIQGRLYPQGNDDHSSAYEPYRNIVQEIMSTLFDFPNLWTLKRGASPIYNVALSRGTHYKDYFNYETCTVSFIKGNKNRRMMIIGAEPICIECGSMHDDPSNINHCARKPWTCKCCGRHLDDDEVVRVDGHIFCDDCAEHE